MSDSNVDQYAVMGNPIKHSLSPVIHSAFAQQTNQQLQYQSILVPETDFAEAVNDFFKNGGKGLNVTVPFKEQAFALAELPDELASAAGAANTLWLDSNNRLNASNTDGLGLIRDLTVNHRLNLKDKNILVLGAGGAVRGVLKGLLAQQPAKLIISNRSADKAEKLAARFEALGPITAATFDAIPVIGFDLVINGTSASLAGKVPAISADLLAGAACYDMMYGANAETFLDWSLSNGATKAVDGLGMLVEQAAEAYLIWRKVRPETDLLIEQLTNP